MTTLLTIICAKLQIFFNCATHPDYTWVPKFICPVPKYFGFRRISAETDAEIPNPKLMSKAEIYAEIPNICRNSKHMPKSTLVMFRSFRSVNSGFLIKKIIIYFIYFIYLIYYLYIYLFNLVLLNYLFIITIITYLNFHNITNSK